MEGLPLAAFRNAATDADQGIRDFAAPEGESWKDVNARAKDFLHNDIIQNYFRSEKKEEEKTDDELAQFNNQLKEAQPKSLDFLVVSHGGFIMEFINAVKLHQDPQYQDKFNNNIKNTALCIFNLSQNLDDPFAGKDKPKVAIRLTLQNDNSHLQQSM